MRTETTRWSLRRSLAFMVVVSLAFWLGMAAAVLFLIPASANPCCRLGWVATSRPACRPQINCHPIA